MTVGRGTKRTPVRQISLVQLKPAGMAVNCNIQFSPSGGNERRSWFGKQNVEAVKDENSIVFTPKHAEEFEAIRTAIEAAMAAPSGRTAPASAADEIAKLVAIRDAGAITDEEFEAHNATLLP